MNEITKRNSSLKSTLIDKISQSDSKDLIGLASKVVDKADPTALITSLKEVGNKYYELQTVREQEQTKRGQIQAEKEVALNKINTLREMFMTYMNKSFDERKDNFAKFFKIVDDAIEKNNMQELQMGLLCINQLAAQSPFKPIADMAMLTRTLESNQELDI